MPCQEAVVRAQFTREAGSRQSELFKSVYQYTQMISMVLNTATQMGNDKCINLLGRVGKNNMETVKESTKKHADDRMGSLHAVQTEVSAFAPSYTKKNLVHRIFSLSVHYRIIM